MNNPTLTGFCRNIMGTVDFDGLFTGMRKAQNFVVYPMQDSGTIIRIQSDHRFGQIDLANGPGVLSENRKQYANALTLSLSLARGTAVRFTLSAEDLQTLRGWVKSTGGVEVGDSLVKSDNTGALAL